MLVLLVAFALILASATIPIRGAYLVGFSYRAVANNEFTVCPDRVTQQSGDVITLGTGDQFRVVGVSVPDLTNALAKGNSCVKVDRAHRYLCVRKHRDICGMRPEMNQWITIPLWASERIETHAAVEFADVEVVVAK